MRKLLCLAVITLLPAVLWAKDFLLPGVLTLTVPKDAEGKDWVVMESREAVATFVGPAEGRVKPAFVLAREKVTTGLEVTDYTREAEKALGKSLTDFKVLSRKSRKLDGEKAREYLYTHALPAGQKVTVRAYVALFNGNAYTLYFRASDEVYEKHVKAFEEVAAGLKWDKPEAKKADGKKP